MGFWSKLGKGLSFAAPIAAAPFTGGTSLLGLAGLGGKTAAMIGAGLATGGKVASGIAQGRAQGRAAEAGINQTQDDNRLRAAQFNLGAPRVRAGNAVRGDLLAGLQDVSFTRPAGIPSRGVSGGVRPSLFSDDTRAMGKEMSRQALLQQMQGDFQPTPLPQSGKFDTLLNILGGAGTAMDAFQSLRQPTAQVMDAPQAPVNPSLFRNVRF